MKVHWWLLVSSGSLQLMAVSMDWALGSTAGPDRGAASAPSAALGGSMKNIYKHIYIYIYVYIYMQFI